MKNLKEYILESKPITDYLIGEIYRFNGAFANILTYLKNNGHKDIRFFKDGAGSNGIHRLRLRFEEECKSDPKEVLDKLQKHFGNTYDYDLYDKKDNDENNKYPEIFVHTRW